VGHIGSMKAEQVPAALTSNDFQNARRLGGRLPVPHHGGRQQIDAAPPSRFVRIGAALERGVDFMPALRKSSGEPESREGARSGEKDSHTAISFKAAFR